ncbi:MBL fold metallo-hydrolase [Hydrogenimonas sp. SS33]|uniref:MBL fold metallo-hydrolase n=1 Tax=Hydrogenimonas leucolamina TaxID=2954236 RepID=UPI00336BF62E
MKRFHNGKFTGKYDTSVHVGFPQILRWKLSRRPGRREAGRPLRTVDMSDRLGIGDDFLCWLSHASFLLQLNGKRLLLDPVFGDIPFYRRLNPAPYTPEQLGKIDYLLLSHTHYDHVDAPSVSKVAESDPLAVVPLHMSRLLKKIAPGLRCVELDWYETFGEEGVKITLVPARHWGRRGLFDKNRALWGGYILQTAGKTIYFAGDTAAGDHFEQIGRRFDIDLALLPIGAYEPAFIMKHNHLNPEEAFAAFRQLGAKKMLPMHYGTFRLSDEPPGEPLERIEKIADAHPGTVEIVRPGEIILL